MSTLTHEEEVQSAKEGLLKEVETEKVDPTRPMRRGPGGGGPGHGPGGGGKIDAKTIAAVTPVIKRLLTVGKRFRAHMITAVIFAIIGAVLSVASPKFLGHITDEISAGLGGHIDMAKIKQLVIICIIILVGSFIFSYMQAWLMATATQKVAQRLRHLLDRKIDRVPLRYFDRSSQGDVLSRFTNDIDILAQTLNNSVSSILSGLTLLIGSMVMMFVTEWRMALAGIAAAIAGFALSMVLMGLSQKHFLAKQEHLGALNGHIEEVFSGHTVMRAYNGERKAQAEFNKRNEKLFHANWLADFLSGMMMPIMGFIGNLGYVAVCVVGAVLVIRQNMDIGVITAFILYIRLFTQPLSNIAQAATQFQGAAAAGTRVFDLLDEEEIPAQEQTVALNEKHLGEVEFKDVRFGYEPDNEIIHGFSADVLPGQKVAVVGPTGAGKTTLVNLLMRFYDVDSGKIIIDGIDQAELTRDQVGQLFSMVLQDTWLFKGTLRENLVYDTEGVTDEELEQVIDDIGLRDLVNQLPEGLDTVLGEETALSAGQKQLITIGRAMLANNPLLILDEATSSIDTRTEQIIQKAVDKLMEGRTSFVIAHRLSTIKNADIIFVMNQGDIVESGTHDELLAKGGFYADLYRSQFEEGDQGQDEDQGQDQPTND